jgi:hypothetical protein
MRAERTEAIMTQLEDTQFRKVRHSLADAFARIDHLPAPSARHQAMALLAIVFAILLFAVL